MVTCPTLAKTKSLLLLTQKRTLRTRSRLRPPATLTIRQKIPQMRLRKQANRTKARPSPRRNQCLQKTVRRLPHFHPKARNGLRIVRRSRNPLSRKRLWTWQISLSRWTSWTRYSRPGVNSLQWMGWTTAPQLVSFSPFLTLQTRTRLAL